MMLHIPKYITDRTPAGDAPLEHTVVPTSVTSVKAAFIETPGHCYTEAVCFASMLRPHLSEEPIARIAPNQARRCERGTF